MGHGESRDACLYRLDQVANFWFRIYKTEMTQQPGLPVTDFYKVLCLSFVGSSSLQLCVGQQSSSCPSTVTETFRFFPLDSTAPLSLVPYT